MKILIVYKEQTKDNPYVPLLKKALIAEELDVVCSADDFWDNFQDYDIVHIQWPVSLKKKNKTLQDIYRQFDLVKKHCKIICTCHNLLQHNTKADDEINRLYTYCYTNCDAIIHLGQYSLDYLKKTMPLSIAHYLVPHHIYDELYKFAINKSIARQKLGIREDANVLLCFGIFRNEKERQLVLQAFNRINVKRKYLLVPGFYRGKILRRNILKGFYFLVKTLWYKINGIHFRNDFLNDAETEIYLCAADILMIQRCSILNSGNVPLGFLAKKVVVGPNLGNVGVILNERGNPTFNPNNNESVIAAIEKGFALKNTDSPQQNYDYAVQNWNTKAIAKKHIEVYKEVLNI